MKAAVMVRPFVLADAAAAADLLGQLGYPVEDESQVIERYARLLRDADQQVLVAENNGVVIGLLHMARVFLLASDGYVEVHALVVAESARGCGAGASLMAVAEAWAASLGGGRVRLRSGMHREAAHRFYQRIGYTAQRVSMAFEKIVVPACAKN